jgi:hypothetical protein
MTPQKNQNLQNYLEDLYNRFASKEVPKKHQDSEKEYREYLALEIRRTKLRLETDLVVLPKGANQ